MNFSTSQLNALKEIISSGTKHASISSSKLIGKEISIDVQKINFVPVTKIPELFGKSDIPIVGLYFKIFGDLRGNTLFVFPEETADSLIKSLIANFSIENTAELDEIGKSALMELGNILTNSFLNSVAQMLDIKVLLSVPHYALDMLGAVIDLLLIEIAQVAEQVLLVKTEISLSEKKFSGSHLIFFDIFSVEKIFDKLRLK